MSWKKSLLVRHKILRHFVNLLTAHDKYSVLNRDNLAQPILIPISEKQNIFSSFFFFCFFFAVLKSTIYFEHFQKKRWASQMMHLLKYGLRKMLDDCLINPVSEDPFTGNMVKEPKHCCNLKESTFTIFLDHCEGNWVGKSLF